MGFNFKHALEDIQLSHTLQETKAERFLRSVVKDLEEEEITYTDISVIYFTLSEKGDEAVLTADCYTKTGRNSAMHMVYENMEMTELVLDSIKSKLKSEGFKVEEESCNEENIIKKIVIIF